MMRRFLSFSFQLIYIVGAVAGCVFLAFYTGKSFEWITG